MNTQVKEPSIGHKNKKKRHLIVLSLAVVVIVGFLVGLVALLSHSPTILGSPTPIQTNTKDLDAVQTQIVTGVVTILGDNIRSDKKTEVMCKDSEKSSTKRVISLDFQGDLYGTVFTKTQTLIQGITHLVILPPAANPKDFTMTMANSGTIQVEKISDKIARITSLSSC